MNHQRCGIANFDGEWLWSPYLRCWAFQGVLLVSADRAAAATELSVSFACVLGQLDEIAAVCEQLPPGCTSGPRPMLWNTVDLEIRTPDSTRVIMTAARPHDPNSAEAEQLRSIGIEARRHERAWRTGRCELRLL
ncbi:VOC family protein [Nocardia sp. NPDC052112]|uniref:VOC family protein n=1 Tax=Nocardia sp. NPDC052112 TaxID=3155646 RepID=UPI003432983C